jgi:hypothetical protein
MSWPLVAALVWIIAANLIAMLPSRDHHWRAAYGLIALGIPILGWLTVAHGPTFGLLFLAAAVSVLRWPVWYLWLWLTGRRRG